MKYEFLVLASLKMKRPDIPAMSLYRSAFKLHTSTFTLEPLVAFLPSTKLLL
jgi:hypothetical protein